jgi:hypothetical protein
MPGRTGRQCGALMETNRPFKLAPPPACSGYSGPSLAARAMRRGARLDPLTRVAERPKIAGTTSSILDSAKSRASPWKEFSAALIRDADAQLDFTAADRAIEEMRKERAERRATDQRLIARIRGEAG